MLVIVVKQKKDGKVEIALHHIDISSESLAYSHAIPFRAGTSTSPQPQPPPYDSTFTPLKSLTSSSFNISRGCGRSADRSRHNCYPSGNHGDALLRDLSKQQVIFSSKFWTTHPLLNFSTPALVHIFLISQASTDTRLPASAKHSSTPSTT